MEVFSGFLLSKRAEWWSGLGSPADSVDFVQVGFLAWLLAALAGPAVVVCSAT